MGESSNTTPHDSPSRIADKLCSCKPHPVFGHEDGCRYEGMGAVPTLDVPPITKRRTLGDLSAAAADDLRDEIDRSIDRLIRAAQHRALSEVVKSIDRWANGGPTAMTSQQRASVELMVYVVNQAADAMNVLRPWTPGQ